MNQCEVVMAPSSWCRDVMVTSGAIPRLMFMVLNHGISDVFAPASNPEIMSGDPDDGFVFLHLCSAVFYPERKGTPQFFEAAEQLVKEGANIIARVVFGAKTRGIKKLLANLSPEMNNHTQMHFFSGARPQPDIVNIYSGCHAAVFPSRAEGFGCIPLEVRACGIPVVQTMCTGHRDHIDPDDDPSRWGIVEIPHGPLEPAWGSFGKAPTVRPQDVYEAMKKCIANYENLREAALDMADAVRTQWSWSETTRPLIEFLRKESV